MIRQSVALREAGGDPKSGQDVVDRDSSIQKTVPLWPLRRLLRLKQPVVGLERNGQDHGAGDGTRTRDSLLGRQVIPKSPRGWYK